MEKLLTTMLGTRGARSYRSMLLCAVVYVAVKVNEIERRVAYLEMHVRPAMAQIEP